MLNETEGRVVYPYIPTSNRNLGLLSPPWGLVVYPYIPTSNRNVVLLLLILRMLYILIFLHQTATKPNDDMFDQCCISLYSYIKPQRWYWFSYWQCVVYPYIPTSNRNLISGNPFV